MTPARAAEVTCKAPPLRRFIRLPEVRHLTGLSTSEIYKRMAASTFPKNVALGPKTVVWLEDDIAAWQAERLAEREVAA
jgi:prophage regulatory protein